MDGKVCLGVGGGVPPTAPRRELVATGRPWHLLEDKELAARIFLSYLDTVLIPNLLVIGGDMAPEKRPTGCNTPLIARNRCALEQEGRTTFFPGPRQTKHMAAMPAKRSESASQDLTSRTGVCRQGRFMPETISIYDAEVRLCFLFFTRTVVWSTLLFRFGGLPRLW